MYRVSSSLIPFTVDKISGTKKQAVRFYVFKAVTTKNAVYCDILVDSILQKKESG
jgi:hypothetical protein